jgi:hypothetical protein
MTAVVEGHPRRPAAELHRRRGRRSDVRRADRITELGLRGAARQIGLRFPAGWLPTAAEVTEFVRREHFGVVRLSGKP